MVSAPSALLFRFTQQQQAVNFEACETTTVAFTAKILTIYFSNLLLVLPTQQPGQPGMVATEGITN
jgi:hypothetical protein